MLDLVLANARLPGSTDRVDIGISGSRIAAIEAGIVSDAPREDAAGRLVFGGFVECHIHLDKADILERCRIVEGTLAEAIRETAAAKAGFTVEDVHRRACGVAARAVAHGVTAMRTFVEVDPRAGLRSLEALKAVRQDMRGAIDIQICAFAQEGITNEPETEALLVAALKGGADLVGGCSYTDPKPEDHIRLIFDLAERFGTDVDFHVDFDLDPRRPDLDFVISETARRGYGGRVTCGHVTKLAAMTAPEVQAYAERLAKAGVAVVALPATDLFLLGRDHDRLVPRGVAPLKVLAAAGVATAVASNNILNPFTPYGDGNLLRMANLYANIAQLARDEDLAAAFGMVSHDAAAIMRRPKGPAVGGDADLAMLDVSNAGLAVRTIAPVLKCWKRGVVSFERDGRHRQDDQAASRRPLI